MESKVFQNAYFKVKAATESSDPTEWSINFYKIGDLKIYWGTSNGTRTITFSEPFTSVGYYAMCCYATTTAASLNPVSNYAYIRSKSQSSMVINTAGGVYNWVAIGY